MEFIAARHAVDELNERHVQQQVWESFLPWLRRKKKQQGEEGPLGTNPSPLFSLWDPPLRNPQTHKVPQRQQQQQGGDPHELSVEQSSTGATAGTAFNNAVHGQEEEGEGVHWVNIRVGGSCDRSGDGGEEVAEVQQAGGGDEGAGEAVTIKARLCTDIILGDRPVAETMAAMWGSLAPLRRLKILGEMLIEVLFTKVRPKGWGWSQGLWLGF
jgi:hypothetical protein